MRYRHTLWAALAVALTTGALVGAAPAAQIQCPAALEVDPGGTWRCVPGTSTLGPSTATPVVFATGTPTPLATPTGTLLPTSTSTTTTTATATATATATRTATPVPPTPTATPPPVPLAPRLVRQYLPNSLSNPYPTVAYKPNGFVNGLAVTDESWGPWTVTNAGPYAGWDFLNLADLNEFRNNATANHWEITLTRPATLGILWRDASRPGGYATPPGPNFTGWTAAGTVTTSGQFAGTNPVYTKSFPAGVAQLPGPSPDGGAVNAYWLVFGEQSGQASVYPTAPAGKTQPTPNALCPTWVHDQYVTPGPDGRTYATWHPQIDPVYWCYFGHEHGSDPALLGPNWQPPFGYSAFTMNMPEAHSGFKVYVLDDAGWNGNRWGFVHHFGTNNPVATSCVRHHELQVAVNRISDGTALARLIFMGDFGASVNPSLHYLTPAACPTQGPDADAGGTFGRRVQPIPSDPAFAMYDPWTADLRQVLALGFHWTETIANLSVNTPDPIAGCSDNACTSNVLFTQEGLPTTGTHRFLTHSNGYIQAGGASSGTFYTDPTGTQVVAAGAAGATQQYLAPGVTAPFRQRAEDDSCESWRGWGGIYTCANIVTGQPSTIWPDVRERSIGAAN